LEIPSDDHHILYMTPGNMSNDKFCSLYQVQNQPQRWLAANFRLHKVLQVYIPQGTLLPNSFINRHVQGWILVGRCPPKHCKVCENQANLDSFCEFSEDGNALFCVWCYFFRQISCFVRLRREWRRLFPLATHLVNRLHLPFSCQHPVFAITCVRLATWLRLRQD